MSILPRLNINSIRKFIMFLLCFVLVIQSIGFFFLQSMIYNSLYGHHTNEFPIKKWNTLNNESELYVLPSGTILRVPSNGDVFFVDHYLAPKLLTPWQYLSEYNSPIRHYGVIVRSEDFHSGKNDPINNYGISLEDMQLSTKMNPILHYSKFGSLQDRKHIREKYLLHPLHLASFHSCSLLEFSDGNITNVEYQLPLISDSRYGNESYTKGVGLTAFNIYGESYYTGFWYNCQVNAYYVSLGKRISTSVVLHIVFPLFILSMACLLGLVFISIDRILFRSRLFLPITAIIALLIALMVPISTSIVFVVLLTLLAIVPLCMENDGKTVLYFTSIIWTLACTVSWLDPSAPEKFGVGIMRFCFTIFFIFWFLILLYASYVNNAPFHRSISFLIVSVTFIGILIQTYFFAFTGAILFSLNPFIHNINEGHTMKVLVMTYLFVGFRFIVFYAISVPIIGSHS